MIEVSLSSMAPAAPLEFKSHLHSQIGSPVSINLAEANGDGFTFWVPGHGIFEPEVNVAAKI